MLPGSKLCRKGSPGSRQDTASAAPQGAPAYNPGVTWSQCETAFCSLFPAGMLPRAGLRGQRVSTPPPPYPCYHGDVASPLRTPGAPREPPTSGTLPLPGSSPAGWAAAPHRHWSSAGPGGSRFRGSQLLDPRGLWGHSTAQVLAASLPQDGLPYTPCQARSFRKCGAGEPRGHGPPHPDLAG